MKKVILVIGLIVANIGIVSSASAEGTKHPGIDLARFEIPSKKQKNPGINLAEMNIPSKKQKNPVTLS